MHDFKKLKVWNKSRCLVKDIFLSINNFPKEELFGLVSQIKRSAISIPSNIAEGCGRDSSKQLIYFLNVALGSAYELETQIIISHDLQYLGKSESSRIVEAVQEISRMLIGLIKQYKRL